MGARSRGDKYVLSLSGVDISSKTFVELQQMFNTAMDGGMHGLCFSPYEDGQEPGDVLTEEQVRRRLEIMEPYTHWVRSFSTTEGNEHIPRIAHELGMKCLTGACLLGALLATLFLDGFTTETTWFLPTLDARQRRFLWLCRVVVVIVGHDKRNNHGNGIGCLVFEEWDIP